MGREHSSAYADFKDSGRGREVLQAPLGKSLEQALNQSFAHLGVSVLRKMIIVHGWPWFANNVDFSIFRPQDVFVQKLIWPLKVVLTVALIVWLFRTFPMDDVFSRVRGMDGWFFGAALLLGMLVWLLQATRWRRTTPPISGPLPSIWVFLYYTSIGYFFNVLLPSGIGGDAVKSVGLGRAMQDTAGTVAAVFMARVMGISVLLATFWIAFLLWSGNFPASAFWGMAAITGATLVGWVLFLGPWDLPWLKGTRFQRILEFRRFFGLLGKGWRETFAIQAMTLFQQWLFFRSVGVEMPFMAVALFIPPITLLTMIPVSLYGMGVREWATVGLFTLSGFSAAECLAASGPAYLLVFIQALLGGVWLGVRTLATRKR